MEVKEEVTNDIFEIKMKEVCDWDKRKKCDSLYIEMYNNALKKIEKLEQELNKKGKK